MAAKESVCLINVTEFRCELDGSREVFDPVHAKHVDNESDLLAVASKSGARIIGHPSSSELQFLCSEDKMNVPCSKLQLRGVPRILSLNCTDNILAVNYDADGKSFVDIFSVESLASNTDLRHLNTFPFNCMARQILWNPTVKDLFAICLEDGTLIIYYFSGKDEYASRTIEQEKARCFCWSAQGKQIFFALPNGAIYQCDMGSSSVKIISTKQDLFDQPYEPIALQWLSTHQFAIVFLEHSTDARPKFFIVNTNGGQPTYLKLDDIYYGPQASQVYLLHLPSWNMILTGSRKKTQINILTAENISETPTWTQLDFVDKKRARLPLESEDCSLFSMLGIALENQTPHLPKENPRISIILTSGRLVTIKLMLAKIAAVDVDNYVFAAGCILRLPDCSTEVGTQIGSRSDSHSFLSPGRLAILRNPRAHNRCDTILNFATMREMMSKAVRKLHSAVQSSLNPIENSSRDKNSDEWLEYLRLLAAATETTTEEMECLQGDLNSFLTILGEARTATVKNIDMLSSKSQVKHNMANTSEGNLIELMSADSDQIEIVPNRLDTDTIGINSFSVTTRNPNIRVPTPPLTDSIKKTAHAESHPFLCAICNNRYVRKSGLGKHIRTAHMEKQSESESNATAKIQLQSGARSPQPEEIEQGCDRSAQGKIPQSQKSPDTHPFLCAICNNRYLNKSTLAKHILKAHVNQQSYRKNRRPQRKPTTMKRVKKNPLIAMLSQKTAESHPFLCDICGDRYKHVGRLAEHHRRDHAETRMSTPIRINQVGPMIHYVCECTYTTSEPGHYHRHRSVCKRKSGSTSRKSNK